MFSSDYVGKSLRDRSLFITGWIGNIGCGRAQPFARERASYWSNLNHVMMKAGQSTLFPVRLLLEHL